MKNLNHGYHITTDVLYNDQWECQLFAGHMAFLGANIFERLHTSQYKVNPEEEELIILQIY